MPAFSRAVGYLGNAWWSSDSQILARNGVFVVTAACKSKTTQKSALCLDEASAVCQARTPRKWRMRISSVACVWDFERPRPQIPIPRNRKVFVVIYCCVQSGNSYVFGLIELSQERVIILSRVNAKAFFQAFFSRVSAIFFFLVFLCVFVFFGWCFCAFGFFFLVFAR